MSDDVPKTQKQSRARPCRGSRATVARPVACNLPDMLSLLPEEARLVGLVHSLTPKPDDPERRWWMKPAVLGAIVLAVTVALNIVFA